MSERSRKKSEWQKAWRLKNPGYWKTWSKQNPEKHKQYAKTSYLRNKEKRNQESKDWRLDNIAYNAVRSARVRCRHSGMEFNLDREWAENKYTGICELSGIKFDVSGSHNPYAPSLDRIDNSKGYLKDNCRFILHGLNMLKGIGTDEDMYIIADNFIAMYERKKKV